MAITTKIVSSNHVHAEVYLIQHHVIKFVSNLRQVGVFSGYSGFLHDITEILLKVALNTTILTLNPTLCNISIIDQKQNKARN